ncbi:hypothetical protein ACF0H5_012921 [Mactra antiquata]
METEELKYQDIAAQLALFNMLKINLSCCPDVYKTLLAVLSDFDPNNPHSKSKTSQYVRLLISDRILADCIIVSLPQGDRERLMLQSDASSSKNESYAGKRGILTSDQQSQTKDLDSIETPDNSITIIVTGQKDPPVPIKSSLDNTSSLLGKQILTTQKKGQINNSSCLKTDQPKVVKVVSNPKNKTDADTNSPIHPNSKTIQDVSSKSLSTIQTTSSSVPTIKPTNSVVMTTSINPGLKATDSLKTIRPKLVLPVPLAGISPALLSLPFASISSDNNVNLQNDSMVTSCSKVKAPQCSPILDYQFVSSNKTMSSASINSLCATEKCVSNKLNPGVPVSMKRKCDQVADKKVVGVPEVSSGGMAKTSNSMKRLACLPIEEEPVRKKKVLSVSGNKENTIHIPRDTQCNKQMIDKRSAVDLTGSQQKSECIESKAPRVNYSSASSYMPVLSNVIGASKAVNSSKDKAIESGTSVVGRGNTMPKEKVTDKSKGLKQPSVFIPNIKVPTSTCVTSAKEYHLSYPLKKRRDIFNSNISPTSPLVSSLPPQNYITNTGEIAEFIATPISNTIYCGLAGSRSFPYRQQIQLSHAATPAHVFPSNYIGNNSSTCPSNLIGLDTHKDLVNDSEEADNDDSLFELVRPHSAGSVNDQTPVIFGKSRETIHYKNFEGKQSDRLEQLGGSLCSKLNKGDPTATDSDAKNKQTFLIIETKTSSGSDQVQISLNPQTSGNLIGELLKLKPGLGIKQGVTGSENLGNKLEIPPKLTDNVEDTTSQTVTNVDEFLNFGDKTTISDLSDEGTSNSEEFHCSDDQYEFPDQSDIIPIQVDNCPGQPKVVSFPMLNQASLTSDRQQNRGEDVAATSNMTRSYSEPRTNISTPVFPIMSTKYTDNARSDSMSSGQTGDGDFGSSQFRFSSYGMSPYLMRFISDIDSNSYEDDLSDLEGSDTVFSSKEYEEN